jgi:hypothetical protein
MSSRRKRREVNVPKGELGIEDRRGSTIGAPGPDTPVVDYHGDPDRCEEVIAALTDEYGRYLEAEHALCPDCPVVCSGSVIVGSMLRWKAIHRDGRLGHWTREDIRAFLLDHFPRTVSFDPHLLGDAPTCAKDLVYFMSDRGTLAGDHVRVLVEAIEGVLNEPLTVPGHDPRVSGQGPAPRRTVRNTARAPRKHNLR